jgi:hypothetical protein
VLGLTDHHEQCPFEDTKGIQTIAPGGELCASFTMGSGTCLLRLTTALAALPQLRRAHFFALRCAHVGFLLSVSMPSFANIQSKTESSLYFLQLDELTDCVFYQSGRLTF